MTDEEKPKLVKVVKVRLYNVMGSEYRTLRKGDKLILKHAFGDATIEVLSIEEEKD